MMDKYDKLEDKFCAILSAISDQPRGECDKMMKQADMGVTAVRDVENEMIQIYGQANLKTAMQIMKLVYANMKSGGR